MIGKDLYQVDKFAVSSNSCKISASTEIDEISKTHDVNGIPDSFFGGNFLKIDCPDFTLEFSGADSIRTMKTNPEESIGIVNNFITQKENAGKLEFQGFEYLASDFQNELTEESKVILKDVGFKPEQVLYVPPMNVKVASSKLWIGKNQTVNKKMNMNIPLEKIEQDWTYMNAYEGALKFKKNQSKFSKILFHMII